MRLEQRVSITVPSTLGTVPAPAELVRDTVNNALRELSVIAGGATAIPGRGAWVMESGELVTEEVVVVESYTTEVSLDLLRVIVRLRRTIKESMQQEAVAVNINGALYV